jgi:hypothetical protein
VSSCPAPSTQPRCVDTKLTSLAAKLGRTEAGALLLGVEAGEGAAAADAAVEVGVELEVAGPLEVPQAVATAKARRAAPAPQARIVFIPLRRCNARRRWTDGWFHRQVYPGQRVGASPTFA